jgi:hypothetical protein
MIERFRSNTVLNLHYVENTSNLGFDANLRELIRQAKGDYVIFMGDDDYFVRDNLKTYIQFLKENQQLGYVLKTWLQRHPNGWDEPFNYFNGRKFFPAGTSTYISLFRISVFISGFTFRREFALPYLIDRFDGTLLYQIYLLAEIVLNYPSAFCEIPLTIQETHKTDAPQFGSSEKERSIYTPGEITIDNSINFLKGFFKISEYIDEKYMIQSTHVLRTLFSKYSYNVLAIQRNRKRIVFYRYVRRLAEEVGLNKTYHFYLYSYALFILGRRSCDAIIFSIKRFLKRTPGA